jgi:hypothetical protein
LDIFTSKSYVNAVLVVVHSEVDPPAADNVLGEPNAFTPTPIPIIKELLSASVYNGTNILVPFVLVKSLSHTATAFL